MLFVAAYATRRKKAMKEIPTQQDVFDYSYFTEENYLNLQESIRNAMDKQEFRFDQSFTAGEIRYNDTVISLDFINWQDSEDMEDWSLEVTAWPISDARRYDSLDFDRQNDVFLFMESEQGNHYSAMESMKAILSMDYAAFKDTIQKDALAFMEKNFAYDPDRLNEVHTYTGAADKYLAELNLRVEHIPSITFSSNGDDCIALGIAATEDKEALDNALVDTIQMAGAMRKEEVASLYKTPAKQMQDALSDVVSKLEKRGMSLPDIGKAMQQGFQDALQAVSSRNIENKFSK